MLRPRIPSTRTIGIFAPSSPFDAERFERGRRILENLGYGTKCHPHLHQKQGFLAGGDQLRIDGLHDLLKDDGVDIIMAARGGYGAARTLRGLNRDLIAEARKPIVGFSDVTALHAFAQSQANLSTLHGPVVTQLGDLGEADHQRLATVLLGKWSGLTYQSPGPSWVPGVATGPLIGGCLSVLVTLIGTPYLHWPRGAILLLEDVGEAPYRIDRMLTHLRLAGLFDSLGGIALGEFANCKTSRPGEQSVEDVLLERLGDLGVPVLAGLPFGHGPENHAIPLGVEVTLDSDQRTLVVS